MSAALIYQYKGRLYPQYLKDGDACRFIAPMARTFCKGNGLDVGAGKWPLEESIPVDLQNGGDAMSLPEGQFDYVFSSHCLEHLKNPVAAIEHWKTRIRPGGVLFLYLPHPDMEYWLPQNNRKHLHVLHPADVEKMVRDLGFVSVIRSERDLAWSFAVVGFKPGQTAPADNLPAPDTAFRWLMEQSSDHVHADPNLSEIFRRFGADAFRRSSGVEPEFIRIIEKANFRGRRCVECGTYNGITAIILSRFFEEVVSIDIFPHTIKHTLIEHLGITNIRFVDVKDNAEKARVVQALDGFDGAYVDGDHQNDTESDFALVKDCGRVLFHEYWEQQKPVWELVDRLRGAGTIQVEGKFALWTKAR